MDMKKHSAMVSIVSPVYNGEDYVGRMLSSVLSQSYPNIEMICVDDGSQDNTEAVIKSFAGAFEERGMRLVYARLAHAGQTAAVSAGLKLANGEFLSWVDSDDFLVEHSIEAKLSVLVANPEYAIVTSNYNIVNEENLQKVIYRQGDAYGYLNYQSKQFHLAVSGMSIYIPNNHLVRMECFDQAFPERELVPCLEGQNTQLILPLYYRYRRLYIERPLAYYVVRRDSHYHRKRSPEEWEARYAALMEMLRQVLEGLGFVGPEMRRILKSSFFNKER